ncbi:hypothetical protein JXA48_02805 [Candidatus Woesearchaeota archaeon]|nr:hypothetical protein [Candidatus Woesearchaeota archaeon]
MLNSVVTILVTLIIGPFMFYILSRHYGKEKHLKKYPVGLIDGWGDIIFLPLFNAVAIATIEIFKPFIASIACLLGLILTTSFIIWRKNYAHHNDWSRPKKYVFNNGGWYHASYMFIQASFVFYTLILHYNKFISWIPLSGYLILVVIRFVQVHEKIDEV